jgi:tripartite-type tricarboxylate transporter receptor subunit TctC
MKRRNIIVLGIVGAILMGSMLTAAEEHYPAKAITIIVPEVPGSAADLLSRIIGKSISEALGQPVKYENLFLEAGVVAGA